MLHPNDSSVAAVETDPGARRRPVRPSPSPRWHLAMVLVFLACSAVAVGMIIDKYPYPSPIDEVVHYDYIHDVPHVPVNGERVSQDGLDLWACRTSGPEYVLPLPACTHGGSYDADAFPGQGFSTAGSTPPVYYAATAVIARPLAAVTGWSLFDVARGVGALWLTAFMVVAYLLARRLRVAPLTAASAALFTGLSPGMVSSSGTLGPDTATAVAAGLVLLAAVAYDGTRRWLLLLLGAVALAALTKFTAFTAVGVAILYLLVRPLLARGSRQQVPTWGQTLLAAGGAMGVFGVISFLWGVHFQSTSQIDPDQIPINVMLHADTVPWGSIREFLLYVFFSPATGNWQPSFINDATNVFLITVMAGTFIVSAIAAALALRDRPRAGALGLGIIAMTLVSPFVLVALNFYANHLYFQLSPRYGYAMLPAMAAVVAWMFRSRPAGRAMLLLAVLSVVNILT